MYQAPQKPNFAQRWDEAYRAPREATASFSKALREANRPLIGHPDYEHLEIGETLAGTTVAVFMDIRGFTKLAIALDPTETVRILQATLAASIYCIEWYGGHIADLTGDGIMALFNGSALSNEQHAFNAACAAGMLMMGVRDTVNERLQDQNDQTVRVGMGMEYGDVVWTRLGLPSASQVKPISGISFLAGKLSTAAYTDSWQCKVGQNLAAWVPDEFKTRAPRYEFEYKGRQYTHDLYLFNWEAFHRAFEVSEFALKEAVRSRRLPRIARPQAIGAAGTIDLTGSAQPRGGPRPLKDQPFFGQEADLS